MLDIKEEKLNALGITNKCFIFNLATCFHFRSTSSSQQYEILLAVLMVFYFFCYSNNIATFRGANPGCRVAREPKFCTAGPNAGICGS